MVRRSLLLFLSGSLMGLSAAVTVSLLIISTHGLPARSAMPSSWAVHHQTGFDEQRQPLSPDSPPASLI